MVALTGIGMLSTTGIVVAEDTFGPIADNAQGIAEMSGELEVRPNGSSTASTPSATPPLTKGFAIGSAVIAAVALFALFRETIAPTAMTEVGNACASSTSPRRSTPCRSTSPIPRPAGALIGGTVVFLFSSLAILAVGRTAGTVVQEVRRQFREKPGIMDYLRSPTTGRSSTSARRRLRELTTRRCSRC